MKTAVKTQEFDPKTMFVTKTGEVKRLSKTWLAMEECRKNPVIKILDMRAVLR